MKTIIISTFLALSVLIASAQQNSIDSLKTISVGAKLPASMLEFKSKILGPGGITEASLTEHAGKLIIIDFWAVWCGSCIKNFPLLDSLQQQYPDDLKVLLVNSVGTLDKNEDIIKTLGEKTGKSGAKPLSSVIEDSLFLKAFPHRAIPHYVWIYGNTVQAITTSTFLTRANLEMMIARAKKASVTRKTNETRRNLKRSVKEGTVKKVQ